MRLAEHPRIIAVKEASANLEQIMTIARDRPEGFSVLSGDDSWTLPILGVGRRRRHLGRLQRDPGSDGGAVRRASSGRLEEARRIHERHLDLFRANFFDPNPVPVKAALAEMGLIEDVLRQPLMPLVDAEPQPPARGPR